MSQRRNTSGLRRGGAKGGARPGAGRDPEWLKQKCASLVDRHELIQFLADVARGAPVKKAMAIDGKIVETTVSADVKDRIRATEILIERSWGKVAQPVQHSGEVAVFELISKAAESGD